METVLLRELSWDACYRMETVWLRELIVGGFVTGFHACAATGTKSDWAQSGAVHQCVEEILATLIEKIEGFLCFDVVGGLHEDIRHALSGPIGFEEGGEFRIVAGKAGVARDGNFQVVEEGSEGGCPGRGGKGLAVEAAGEGAERLPTVPRSTWMPGTSKCLWRRLNLAM